MWNHKNHSATPIIFHFQTLAKFNDCSSCREYSEQYCLETAKFHWKLTAGVKWALLTYTDFHFLCQCRACIMLKSSWHRQNSNIVTCIRLYLIAFAPDDSNFEIQQFVWNTFLYNFRQYDTWVFSFPLKCLVSFLLAYPRKYHRRALSS